MDIFLTVLCAVLVFGFLILTHELGHYITARIFHVTIKEFSIGMGPRLISYTSKKTGIVYSLAMLPFGGFVAMAGEDEESEDPNALDKKPAWQRFIITAAGAAVNILTGLLLMILLTALINIGGTEVVDFPEVEEGSYAVRSEDSGLAPGDVILRVDGKRVRILDELSYEIMRRGTGPIDLVVLRDGEEVTLENVVFPTEETEGQTFGAMDFRVRRVEKTFGRVIGYSFQKTGLVIRMCWESLFDLIVGRYTIAAVSGPVGISSAIGDAAKAGFTSLLYIAVIIGINLGVMNLLPIPALDGGRLVLLLLEMIAGKPVIPRKAEGMINGVALLLLLGLMAVVTVKDVFGLFH